MYLNHELKRINAQFIKSVSQDILDVLREASEKLAREKIEEKALKVGDKMPTFALKNAVKTLINSNDLLAKGPLVINFYRGGW